MIKLKNKKVAQLKKEYKNNCNILTSLYDMLNKHYYGDGITVFESKEDLLDEVNYYANRNKQIKREVIKFTQSFNNSFEGYIRDLKIKRKNYENSLRKTIEIKCRKCKKSFQIEMTDEQYDKWIYKKDLIQNIFPNMKAEERELLISRICPECWNKFIKSDEEDC